MLVSASVDIFVQQMVNGLTLGAVYATLFPDHLRAMVVDGATDPNVDRKSVV